MPKAFLACNVNKFMETESYIYPTQAELLNEIVEGDLYTDIHLEEKNFYNGFAKYKCHHDFKQNKTGKVFGKKFNYYFEPLNFDTYFSPNDNLAFISTKTEASLDFMKYLNSSKHFKMEPIQIDFSKIYPLILEVAGAWIADIQKVHLRTAGYFGPNVHKSDEFKAAANEGNVSSVNIKFCSAIDNEEYQITISKKGSITLYDSFKSPFEELRLVLEVYNRLLNPHHIL
ncbi:hypothetical protein [Bacillus altitudinis]|uniref:hypothetical protein n=1 Tax=Bacillus altitudinis TaxID=293387 RepID=UPI0020223EBD|nr:hypothetical protein [Bacillus altitudinis]MCL7871009.1 hypothetical protein [Bacillus altitudinis]